MLSLKEMEMVCFALQTSFGKKSQLWRFKGAEGASIGRAAGKIGVKIHGFVGCLVAFVSRKKQEEACDNLLIARRYVLSGFWD